MERFLRTRGRGGRCFWTWWGCCTHELRIIGTLCPRPVQDQTSQNSSLWVIWGLMKAHLLLAEEPMGNRLQLVREGFNLLQGHRFWKVAHALEDGILHIVAALNGLSGLKRGQEVGWESGRRCEKIWPKHSMPMWNSQIINKKEKHSIPCLLLKIVHLNSLCVGIFASGA